jgi:hypothetical protein
VVKRTFLVTFPIASQVRKPSYIKGFGNSKSASMAIRLADKQPGFVGIEQRKTLIYSSFSQFS